MKERFTIDGSEALEQHLWRTCAKVLAGVRGIIPNGTLEAIYLGGGYGRGEGGVLKTENSEQPYNDLEFWVFLHGNHFVNERKYRERLQHLGEELSRYAGIEVEFKIASVDKLTHTPTMFAYDLAMGHRRIFGQGGLLARNGIRDPKNIPLYEATRLLMNRCSGLLFSQERLQRQPFTREDADFVGRNQAKAQLGFGDVVLTAFGQYHWSCRERNECLKKLSEEFGANTSLAFKLPFSITKIFCHHSLGVDFKLHPQKKTGAAENFRLLQQELRELGLKIWLWLESQRLNHEFNSVRDYALSDLNKCPETNPTRNRLVNAKAFGPMALLSQDARRYPRERILNSLALLLWEPSVLENAFLLEKVQSELRTEATTFPEMVRAYEQLWRQFN